MPKLCRHSGAGNRAVQVFEGNTRRQKEPGWEEGKVVGEEINHLKSDAGGGQKELDLLECKGRQD